MKNKRIVDTLKGKGKIFRGGALLMDAPYSIEIWQDFPSGIPGLKEAVGVIGVDMPKIIPLIGEELVLEFQDGKRMGFFFSASDGRIANTTDIQDAQGQAAG
jgi:hypothetical protein